MKQDPFEEKLSAVRALRTETDDARRRKLLETTLAKESSWLVAEAAKIIHQLDLEGFDAALQSGFARMMVDPAHDKGCVAKEAIADALYQLDCPANTEFLKGIRYVQMEPGLPPLVDSAVGLRAVSAMALVRSGHFEMHRAVARLLSDKEPGARSGAAQAIGYSQSDRFEPLLHYKLMCGDPEPEVVQECMMALLSIAGEEAVSFLVEFLHSGDEVAVESAALSLGQSRSPAARQALIDWWESGKANHYSRTCMIAVALSRSDEAIEFLVRQIAEANGSIALDALQALATYSHDPSVRERVSNSIELRDSAELRGTFHEFFSPPS